MTTWEKATDAEVIEIRDLLRKAASAGLRSEIAAPQLSTHQLGELTKRQAGQLRTLLRELLKESPL